MMSDFLSREQILAIDDLPTETVDVPEWGGKVIVKAMTAGERDRFESSLMQGKGKNRQMVWDDARAKLVCRTVVDAEGKPLFSERDVRALANKSAAALDRIFDVGRRLSGMSDEDMEELTGNSEAEPDDASSSGSPSPWEPRSVSLSAD